MKMRCTNSLHMAQMSTRCVWYVSSISMFGVIFILCFSCAAVERSCSCRGTSECDFKDVCRPAGSCRQENVALGKQATASSLYNHTGAWNETSGPACLAVNGDISTVFNPINNFPWNPTCVHTADGDNTPYWEVDLGEPYIISSITVYGRDENTRNMLASATVKVDETQCYTFESDWTKMANPTIILDVYLAGSKVKIQKFNQSEPFLAICEVQVWACINGFYDVDCTKPCGNCSMGSTCHPRSGECEKGCTAGYQLPYCNETCDNGLYGINCTSKCGNCSDGATCDRVEGVCPGGCSIGYQPPYCNITCDKGWYGVSCNMLCGNCSSGITCDVYSGVCQGGCSKGYQPPYCNETCNVGFYGAGCEALCGNCTGNSPCNIYDGRCEAGCAAGFKLPLCTKLCSQGEYGPNCNNTCGSCSEGTTCNVFNGECPRDCKPGYLGSHCNQSCRAGTYGVGCKETCGNCTGNSPCHVSDGRCQTGCAAGYLLPFCKDVCSQGKYGPNCNNTCGSCSEGATCNVFNGECPRDCKPGYLGSHCNQSCRAGTYGVGCNETCGNCTGNSPCHVSDGRCETGCAAGFQPPLCKEDTTGLVKAVEGTDKKVPLIAGVTVPCVVVLVIIIVVLAVFFVRRRKTKFKQYEDNVTFELETAMSRQHKEDREALTPVSSSSNESGENAMKIKDKKPSIAVKPTVVKMSKEARAEVKGVVSENVYANVAAEPSPITKTNHLRLDTCHSNDNFF